MSKSIDVSKSLTIAIVAGEFSGDVLGGGLVKSLKNYFPTAKFIGIAGNNMQREGCHSLYNIEDISVMGILEVLKHLRKILKIRKDLTSQLLHIKPDIYIGIDAPDFNLAIEKILKQNNIKTVHYVSPSVWAWRQNRIYKIAKATNLVLAFLPFEKAFYDKFNIPCKFIGHKMADDIPLLMDKSISYQRLDLTSANTYICLLPGSRIAEIEILAETFLATASILKRQFPKLNFILPIANQKCLQKFNEISKQSKNNIDIKIIDHSLVREAINISTATLVTSGTATLEVMLCKSPMVVVYKMKPITYWIAKKLVKTPFISIPNLLAKQAIVPEMIQDDCTPEKLADKLSFYLQQDDDLTIKHIQQLTDKFTELHLLIRRNADNQAALAVKDILTNV